MHGNKAHEPHRSEDALYPAWRDKEDPKLRELMRTKERAPPTPTPPTGSRKASPPDSALLATESPPLLSLRGAASKTTKTRRQFSGLRKTQDNSLFKAGVSLPLAVYPCLPNGTPVCTPTPLEGIARTHQVSFRHLICSF